jgi:hypothetical protein
MRILTILLAALVLAGCGGTATVPTTDATTVPGTDTTAVVAPTEAATTAPVETAAPAETATGMIGPTERVMASLVQQLGAEGANLQFVSAEEQEWPTPGLGCEQEGMMYTQVITPGYKITFTDGTNTYAVHTDQTGERAVLCENGVPTDLSTVGS